jgi:VanZ family protein
MAQQLYALPNAKSKRLNNRLEKQASVLSYYFLGLTLPVVRELRRVEEGGFC